MTNRSGRGDRNKKPVAVEAKGFTDGQIAAMILGIVTLFSILLIGLFVYGSKSYTKTHSIPYVVLYNAGETLAKVQHKHNATLVSETWIRVKATETGLIRDYTISNPIVARDMVVGSSWVVRDPDIGDFNRYGYDTPWYTSEILLILISFLLIICIACWAVVLIES